MASEPKPAGLSPTMMAAILVVVIAVIAGGLVLLTSNPGANAGGANAKEPEAEQEAVDPFEGLPREEPPPPRSK